MVQQRLVYKLPPLQGEGWGGDGLCCAPSMATHPPPSCPFANALPLEGGGAHFTGWQDASFRRRVSGLSARNSNPPALAGGCLFVRYHRTMDYQAKLPVPFGILGIRCTGDALTGIDFLPANEKPQRATSAFAATVCEQLLRYLDDPDTEFSVPLELNGTAHQQKVWQALLDIPRGKTRSYGELAAELKSCAQAVGQACGANPIPIIIPCHRVVAKAGLGGFARHTVGEHLDTKRWLLAHEQR